MVVGSGSGYGGMVLCVVCWGRVTGEERKRVGTVVVGLDVGEW